MTFELGTLHRTQPHLLADLAELILAVHYNNHDELSPAMLARLSKEMDIDLDNEDVFIADTDIENCWTQLEYREKVFTAFYPFKIENNRLLWQSKRLSKKQQLYLFLLVCSRLRSFENNGFRQYAAKTFTQICRDALQILAGEHAVVRIFDANSEDRKIYYGTDFRTAIKKLAQDMGASVINETAIAKESSSGDYGLDLVAVYRFNDGAAGSYNIVGQCGAQETDWIKKTLEAHPIRLNALFSLPNQPDNLLFIPLSYREATGDWIKSHSGCLLIDRQRILQLLDKEHFALQTLNNHLPILQLVCPRVDIT